MKLLLLLALILCGCRTPDPFPIETKADKDFEAGRITADEWARLTGVDESVDTIIRLQGQLRTNYDRDLRLLKLP
jgi:hypothetical protein